MPLEKSWHRKVYQYKDFYYMRRSPIDDLKRISLRHSIHVAARKIAEGYFECNTEEVEGKDLLADGRINPNWLDDGYCDQVSEYLYGDTQADDIEPDKYLFPESEYEGKYETGNKWNLIERYIDSEDVDEIFYEEWNKLLEEKYGANWRDLT